MPTSAMLAEIHEIPEAARRLLRPDVQDDLFRVAQTLREENPAFIVTIGRGSSAHAAHCLKHVIEMSTGIPVVTGKPSLTTVFGQSLRMQGGVALAVSQSGASPDLCALAHALREGGARMITLTNTANSPLAALSDDTLPIAAGPEQAVAATKSFMNSVLAGLWLLAHWRNPPGLKEALRRLPSDLQHAMTKGEDKALTDHLVTSDRVMFLGRGPSEGLARELALKTMELLAIPAFGFSTAEALHGPAEILDHTASVAVFAGHSGQNSADIHARLQNTGSGILEIHDDRSTLHPAIAPLPPLLRCYLSLEHAARVRSRNPDRPKHLVKVTRTF